MVKLTCVSFGFFTNLAYLLFYTSKKLIVSNAIAIHKQYMSLFTMNYVISNELIDFLGKDAGTVMSHVDVAREINAYILSNGLKDPVQGRQINADAKLSKLLKLGESDNLTYFNLQKYLKPHFIKPIPIPMKFVYYGNSSKAELMRVMNLVLPYSTKLESTLLCRLVWSHDTHLESARLGEVKKMLDDTKHIYICYDGALYSFDRYNADFIAAVEQDIAASPNTNNEQPFRIFNKDPRFKFDKYYNIIRHNDRTESVELNKDLIIDELCDDLEPSSESASD